MKALIMFLACYEAMKMVFAPEFARFLIDAEEVNRRHKLGLELEVTHVWALATIGVAGITVVYLGLTIWMLFSDVWIQGCLILALSAVSYVPAIRYDVENKITHVFCDSLVTIPILVWAFCVLSGGAR